MVHPARTLFLSLFSIFIFVTLFLSHVNRLCEGNLGFFFFFFTSRNINFKSCCTVGICAFKKNTSQRDGSAFVQAQ